MAPVQANASVAATGLGIRYIGEWAYSLSGRVGIADSDITLTDFTSGGGVIVAQWAPGYADESSDNLQFRVKFNEIDIYQVTLDSRVTYSPYQYINFIIPPLTRVRVTCVNKSGGSTVNMISNFTGRVYGAE
tara:strand:+ start:712 stop:1107 length:396 start_codon:yes stop_codon:yes gene_type:complete